MGRRRGRSDRVEELVDGAGDFGKQLHRRSDAWIGPDEHDIGGAVQSVQALNAFPFVLANGFTQPALAAVAQHGGANVFCCRDTAPQQRGARVRKYKARDYSSASRAETRFKKSVNRFAPSQPLVRSGPLARRVIHH